MRMKNTLKILLLIFLISSISMAQEEENTLSDFLKNFKISAGVDFYYAYDSDKEKNLREFSISSPYRDEFRLNLAQISLNYNSDILRGIVTLHYGDIPESVWLTNNPAIQEANIGFSPAEGLWIDAGYFLTHIGSETFPSKYYFSTMTLPSYYQPFYQSGIRAIYDFSKKFSAAVHLLNGYHLIEDNNKNKSAAVEISYTPIEFVNIRYNNIIGNEQPSGSAGKLNFFNNLVVSFTTPCGKLEGIADLDFGIQEKSSRYNPDDAGYTYGAILALKYNLTESFGTMLRGDFYQDLDGVYSEDISQNITGIKGNGITLGFEYKPVERAYVRIEGRYLSIHNNQKLFHEMNNSRTEVVLSGGLEY